MRDYEPLREFKYLTYVGTLMTKRLRDRSQYYPEFSELPVDVMRHSQIGSGYKIAELGDLGEVYDRLAKYDIPDIPLKRELAHEAIRYFTDRIHPCEFIEPEGAYDAMDKSKSIGFGAVTQKIFSREDPEMYEYLMKYVELSKHTIHHVIINGAQKDEVRVEDKTPRLFTSFPPEHTFLATCVLGDFMDQFLDYRFCTDGSISSVGDSIQCGAAQFYYEQLSKRPFVYCTDTSAQDSSVPAEFINMVYDEIKTKYSLDDEEDMMFEAVRFNSINKLMNINGDLFLVPRGLGSGDYLTIVINIMWRYYMFLASYNHPLETVLEDNTLIICGDDFVCSSNYDDLNHDSDYAKIEWAKSPISWDDMDFCSIKFKPYIHHDPKKVMAVLNLRKRKVHQLSPEHEMHRLGGLLRVLSNQEVYSTILNRMRNLAHKYPETNRAFRDLFISYDDLFLCYNSYIK
jgi:hypothetical protein